MKKSVFTVLFAFFITYSFSQTLSHLATGSIKGTILTQDDKPAPYVNVLIREINRGTTTDESGQYSFKNVKEGEYTLVASFVGLSSQETMVIVKANETVSVNFTLSENSQQLSEIVISDTRNLNEKPTAIGKVAIKPMDLPQSVIVIDRNIMDRQQTLRMSDLLANTSGVYVMGSTGGFQEEIASRGFAMTGSGGVSNTFKNGARFNNGVMPEMSSLEKVEILKGSNAILFGNVAAGGVLNLVTKKPKFENGGELTFRIGSYDFYKPSLDLYGAVNNSDKVAYRINASYENSRSYRDVVTADRIYFNPSFLIRAGKKTEVLVEGDYLKDNRTADYGTGAIDYKVAGVDRSSFLGANWSYNKAEQKSATATVTHQLNANWQIRGMVSYQGYGNENFGTSRPNAGNAIRPDGTWLRGLQKSGSDQDYYLGQVDVTGKFNTGSIGHTLLIGADIDKYDTKTPSYATYQNPALKNANVYDSINVFDLSLYQQRTDIPALARASLTENPINRNGFYVQDLIEVLPRLKVLAGVRYSAMKSENVVRNYTSGAETKTEYQDEAFTPRFGIVYQPLKDISIFGSYANSFVLNTAVDINGEVLPPSFIDQYEAGVKTDWLSGLVSANLTLYQIVNINAAQPVLTTSPGYNPAFPNAQELAGEITSKGVELDVMTKTFNGFSVIAGYSYNDTRYTKSTQYIEGSRLRYNPAHTANASLYYTFSNMLKGVSLGFTSYYVGDRVAGRSTRTAVTNDAFKLMPVPDYFLFDASAGYSAKRFSIRIKVSNLLNELSYNVHDDNSVNPIAPRMFTSTVAYKL